MSYITVRAAAVTSTWHEITATFPPNSTGGIAAHAWTTANPTDEIIEQSKDVPRNVLGAEVGWYWNKSANALAQFPPTAEATTDSQRQEIYHILRDALADLHVARLAAKTGAVEAASLFVRMIGAYASVNTTNAILDTLKTQARIDLNEAAWAMNTASTGTGSWLVSLASPGLTLYVKPNAITRGGLAVPAASTPSGLVHPTQAQLDAFDVQRSIG